MNALHGKNDMSIKKIFLFLALLPYALFGVGAGLNQAVVIENHGKFPVRMNSAALIAYAKAGKVQPDGMIDKVHCVMTETTKLNMFGDIFDFGDGIESVGDLLVDASSAVGGHLFMIGFVFVFFKKE